MKKIYFPTFLTIVMFVVFLVIIFVLAGHFSVHAQTGPLVPCGNPGQNQCDFSDLFALFRNVINFLIYIAVPLAAISFAYAGFLYLSSAGDSGKVGRAHIIFVDVFFGLAIALAAWLIVNAIASSLLDENFFDSAFWFLGD